MPTDWFVRLLQNDIRQWQEAASRCEAMFQSAQTPIERREWEEYAKRYRQEAAELQKAVRRLRASQK